MARTIYKLKDGTRVPSVTTILGQLGWNKESLIAWANRIGMDGMTLDDGRRPAADIGTVTHAMIHARAEGQELDTSKVPGELMAGVQLAFGAYLEWESTTQSTIVASESPLISEQHRYGGTFDRVFRDKNDRLCLLDFKTGAGIYSDHLLQVAAYGELWNECSVEPIERYHLIRIGRETGAIDAHIRTADVVKPALDAFLLARKLYDAKRAVDRVMK